jgi:cytochrome c oxidase cbb3-type subunit 3
VPALIKSPADVERGRAIFTGTCGAYCHHMTPGPGDAPFLFDCDWLHGGSDQEVFHTITHGVPGTRMVAFGGAMPDVDVWRIVAYLKSASLCKH